MKTIVLFKPFSLPISFSWLVVTAVLLERAFSQELILLDNGEVVEKVLVSSNTQSSLPNRPQDSQSPSSPQDNINPTNENTRLYITLGIVLIVALVISYLCTVFLKTRQGFSVMTKYFTCTTTPVEPHKKDQRRQTHFWTEQESV
uniref:Uncharacterized protein n=1 Tax=Daphnia galeata TaxID=27404 RepID=A0A8J2RJX5_9CRUS|nr:unnamed protein product [Daphnia galeata]